MRPLRLVSHQRRHGFLLLETMLGVAIFAIGVLILAKSLQYCLDAELIRRQEQLALKALDNRMAEINGGALVLTDKPLVSKLEGRYEGITLRQWREVLTLKTDEGTTLSSLYTIRLQAEWQGPAGPSTKEVSFYAYSTE